MDTAKKHICKDTLYQKYIEENLTIPEVANFFNCGQTTVVRRLNQFNINKNRELIGINISKTKDKKYDYGLIKKLYLQDNLTKKQIAAKLNGNLNGVHKAITTMGLKKTQQQKTNLCTKFDIEKDWFVSEYVEKGRSIREIAKDIGCSETVVLNFRNKYSLKQSKFFSYLSRTKNNKNLILVKDEKWLTHNYITLNKTIHDIRREIGISTHIIRKYRNLYKLHKTPDQKGSFLKKQHTSGIRNADILQQEYLDNNLTMKEIGKKYRTSTWTISFYLKKYNIHKNKTLKNLQNIRKRDEKGILVKIGDSTICEIANKYNVSTSHCYSLLKHHNVTTEEEFKKILQEKNTTGQNLLETKFSEMINRKFFNKFIVGARYKPDFKLTENTYINTDGLYWHSEKRKEEKNYHFKMRQSFESNNLRLIQFREDEVIFKPQIVQSMVNNILNNSNKIYARKCDIKHLETDEARSFLENNHLMGHTSAKHIGLFFEQNLVAILSYKEYNKYIKVERFCNKIGTTVVGGFGKLLKQVDTTKSIHYWVDLRYGTGKYLEKLGFKHSHDTLGWKWTDGKFTYNRLKCRANMDERKLTERGYAEEKGWYKIYDAGQRLYLKECHV